MATASAVVKPPASRWILSPVQDALLFIGAPLVAVATLLPLTLAVPSEQLSLWLLAFFTFGHHLPGFLRAYGDPELFRQYRSRFLIAPPLVFAVTLSFSLNDLHGVLLLVFLWDIWHVLMQHYGFMRIYDAKLGRVSARTVKLDRALSLSWYLSLVILSPWYLHNLLVRVYSAGVPVFPARIVPGVQWIALIWSAGLTVVYCVHQFTEFRAGARPNWPKLALLANFIGATWLLYVFIDDFQAGFAIWSAFHCLQYYGIVWVFNRNRAASADAGRFLRWLFRRSWVTVLIYLAAIFAYGSLNLAVNSWPAGGVQKVLMAFVITSGTLHYYYDGFIWKLRRSETSRHLAIDAGRAHSDAVRRWSPLHAGAAVLVLGIGALETSRPGSEFQTLASVAGSLPAFSDVQIRYADALRQEGRVSEALPIYQRVASTRPQMVGAQYGLGLALGASGRDDEAAAAFRRALQVQPGLASVHYNLGTLLVRKRDFAEAAVHFRAAGRASSRQVTLLEQSPEGAEAMNNIGLALFQSGERAAGIQFFRRAIARAPEHAMAQLNLASALALIGDSEGARDSYRAAIRFGDASIRQAAERALMQVQ